MSRRLEKLPTEPSPTDVFGWLNAIFTKETPRGTPPTFMMHRFIASDRMYASVARELQLLRQPDLIFGTWQALLPKDSGAPRFSYVVPKKPPAEEALAARMRVVLSESRDTVEQMIELAKLAGAEEALYVEFGIEQQKQTKKK